MFPPIELHISRVYVSLHVQGLFQPSELLIRVRNIGLHDEQASLVGAFVTAAARGGKDFLLSFLRELSPWSRTPRLVLKVVFSRCKGSASGL